jgi:hypothetical protein
MLYLMAFGTWSTRGSVVLLVSLVAACMALSAMAFVQLLRRRMSGVILSLVFYGIQILEVTWPSGEKSGFNFLPAIFFRVAGDRETPIHVNVVALLLFGFSLLLRSAYRRNLTSSSTAPHT